MTKGFSKLLKRYRYKYICMLEDGIDKEDVDSCKRLIEFITKLIKDEK